MDDRADVMVTAVDRSRITRRASAPGVLRRLGGSLVVSVVTSFLSLSVLGVLTYTDVVSAGVANVVATVAGIGPSYVLNRRWVWRRTGRSSIRREIGPFWTMCLLALVASTATVSAAAEWTGSRDVGDAVRTVVVLVVNIATFGALWVLQFFVLDRVLFSPRADEVAVDGEVDPDLD